MKPSWDDAPEWAQWLARSIDGNWTWFEEKPVLDHEGDYLQNPMTKYKEAIYSCDPCLEERT